MLQPPLFEAAGFAPASAPLLLAPGATGGWVPPSPPWVAEEPVSSIPGSPLPSKPPRSGPPYGEEHTLTAGGIPPSGTAGVGARVPGLLPVVTGPGASMHFQSAGQSASVAQLVAFGWHHPGNDVIVMHIGADASAIAGGGSGSGGGDPAAASDGPTATPTPTPPPPEQAPVTLGAQVKPSPQSESMLQGSCHLNAHTLVVVVVQVSVVFTLASQGWSRAQGADSPLPEQDVDISAWQTMPAPQSESAAQAFGSQDFTAAGGAADASAFGHGASGGQAGSGVATLMEPVHAKPVGQSASVVQVCAAAAPAVPRISAALAATRNEFVQDMLLSPFRYTSPT
jgi:hypothetical protein